MKCPHCKKSVSSNRHMPLCAKNPNRIRSTGRPRKEPTLPAEGNSNGVSAALQDPDIEVDTETRPMESMPDLSPEPPQAPEPPPVLPNYAVLAEALVKTACKLVDQAIANELPEVRPLGAPAAPEPVSDAEMATLSAASEPVVAKYLPKLVDYPEVVLLVVAAGIFAPRFLAARKLAKWCDEEKKRRAAMPLAPAPTPPPVEDQEALQRIGDAWVRKLQQTQAAAQEAQS